MQSALNDNEQPSEAECQRQTDEYKRYVNDPRCLCGCLGQMTQPQHQPKYVPGQPQVYGVGIGGAPTRATTLPEEAKERKRYPIASGLMDYFPDALVAIAHVSQVGNEQHNPGQPLSWARTKSADEADTMLRHFLQRGSLDKDGIRHTAKMAWRALALLQKEIEQENK